jgi:CBS domain-containing protein
LSEALRAARGDDFTFSIQGAEEVVVRHESVMLEACCASFQVHLQVPEPERFCDYYNTAQVLLAPVLAASCNSPVLFGRRLWSETRIALFEQSCDIRTPGLHLRDSPGRVSFGHDWLRGDVSKLFKENIARFRILVGADCDDRAPALWRAGQTPTLKALLLHNGTIYRWLRACYGISPSGKPHLRLELRVLPSGPTIADEIASAALWLGLMCEFMSRGEDLTGRMSFEDARSNFYAAARDGLAARMTWLDGESVLAQPLLLERLLPLAAAGLARGGVARTLVARYLEVLERRVRNLQTGARWAANSLKQMHGTRGGRMTALVAATISRQNGGLPVADWALAELDERTSAAAPDLRVSQYMVTDFVTVRDDDSLELVARLMDWENVRHLIVEDERGRVVGLVTRRRIEQALADPALEGARTAVERVMRRELITIQSVTAAREAIAVMREHKIGFLPVVQDRHVVATLSEPALLELLHRLEAGTAESLSSRE